MSDIEYSVITSDVIKSFDCSTTRNAPFIRPRLDLILELCQSFSLDMSAWLIWLDPVCRVYNKCSVI